MHETLPPPTPRQLAWLEAELGLFCHFGINTFFDKEWSDGTLPAEGFAPTDLDVRQWVDVAKAGGFRYLMLTAKHHDGFCLWPTDTTDYSVARSPWKGGRGDLVADVAEACRDAGIALGLYLSPWDRHEPCYPDAEAYDRFYARQLTELCTRYGELFELWFDGAGSENRVYDWDRFMAIAAEHQPRAMIFNMGNPTIRWVGNEDGLADDPNPLHVHRVSKSAFTDQGETLDATPSPHCLPAECDVAIRQNWFWHADDLATLKSREHLLAIYYRSVGRGSNLLLNMGPDIRGRITDPDAARWGEVHDELQRRFAHPNGCRLTDHPRGLRLDFDRPATIDHLVLAEDLMKAPLVDGFRVLDAAGRELTTGRTIGHKRILPFNQTTTPHLLLELDPPAGPGSIRSAVGYLTGHTTLPSVGSPLDYDAWAQKADRPAEPSP